MTTSASFDWLLVCRRKNSRIGVAFTGRTSAALSEASEISAWSTYSLLRPPWVSQSRHSSAVPARATV